MDARLKEAAKLGFTRALMPARRRNGARKAAVDRDTQIEARQINRLADLVALFGGGQRPARNREALDAQ